MDIGYVIDDLCFKMRDMSPRPLTSEISTVEYFKCRDVVVFSYSNPFCVTGKGIFFRLEYINSDIDFGVKVVLPQARMQRATF